MDTGNGRGTGPGGAGSSPCPTCGGGTCQSGPGGGGWLGRRARPESRSAQGGWKCQRKKMVLSGSLAPCPSSGTHLPGDFEQVNCEGRDGSVAFQLVLEPLGRQGKVSSLLPQPPPDQLHLHLIYTLDSGIRFVFVIVITFLGFCYYYYKSKNCSYIKKYKVKTKSVSPPVPLPRGRHCQPFPACPPDTVCAFKHI